MRSLPTQQIRSGEVSDQEGRMLPQETRSNSIRILSRLVMSTQEQLQARIDFLQTQLDSFEHYLPKTYQLLLKEMDLQHRDLIELKIQDFYSNQTNEQQHKNPDTGDTDQTQKSNHQRARIQ
jgi:alkylated DNA repair dioxygenase AlkB